MMVPMDGVVQACLYAKEALQLLLRRPSLLLVALAFGAIVPIDTDIVGYLLEYRTPLGAELRRDLKQAQQDKERFEADEARRRRQGRDEARLAVTSPGAPSVWAPSSLVTPWALAYKPTAKPKDPSHGSPAGLGYLLVLWLLYSPAAHALAAFTAGGYMSVLRDAVAGEEMRWPMFFAGGRRVFWRFILICIAFSAVRYPIARASTAFPGLVGIVMGWALVAGALWLVMWEPIIVWDQCSAIAALRRSADVVSKYPAVAVVLGVGTGLTQWLIMQPYWALLERLPEGPASLAQAQSLAWAGLPVHLLWAALGAWFCAAAFVWYREASAPAARASHSTDQIDMII